MTDIVLDAKVRAMSVGELLERTALGPVRLIDAKGNPLGELAAANPFPDGFRAGVEASPAGADRRARLREGAVSGDELRARLRGLIADSDVRSTGTDA
ncbi:hypothetical protein [Alienimonas chondri]|uniref:CBS domain-containing protein n=1 Tax=Alienimonas chondri TaxID=2681879 RepID=A0ABX1VH46_9PLAN|nr:hypothetical protein [Alienimonas chondri]NNJ27168.1 hypothetical protein [Alienimonas chondri]